MTKQTQTEPQQAQEPQMGTEPQQAQTTPQMGTEPQQAQTTPQNEPQGDTTQNGNAYQSIIEQQQAQINALLEQTANLNQQIVNMVNSGAQFASTQTQAQAEEPKPMQQFNPQPLSAGDDWSLESLAKEIGKK